MKRYGTRWIAAAMLLALLALCACGKQEPAPTTPSVQTGTSVVRDASQMPETETGGEFS